MLCFSSQWGLKAVQSLHPYFLHNNTYVREVRMRYRGTNPDHPLSSCGQVGDLNQGHPEPSLTL